MAKGPKGHVQLVSLLRLSRQSERLPIGIRTKMTGCTFCGFMDPEHSVRVSIGQPLTTQLLQGGTDG
jgi:hypothetical protein